MIITVNKHNCIIEKELINEKEVNITNCKFIFDEDITNEFVKEAFFTLNGSTYKQIILNNECDIPSEVLVKKGVVEVGVVAKLIRDNEIVKLYNPTPTRFSTLLGTLKDAENSQPITPSEFDQYEQALQDGLAEADAKIDELSNLNIDVTKEENVATITLTDKEGIEHETYIYDGVGLNYDWSNTSLGIKREDEENYEYVDLKGPQGETGRTATIEVGTVTTLPAGSNATVQNVGTENDGIFNFGIPQGIQGEQGPQGDDYVITQSDYDEIAEIVETDIDPILQAKADKTEIPTKTSDLINDSNFAKTNQNNNFSTAQTVNGTLTVNGDIVQSGQSYETHAEQLYTKKDLIKTRDGAIGGLASNEVTGIEAINYDGANNGRLVFDNTGTARVGDVGDEVPLCARDESINLTDGQVLVWDSTNLIAKGNSDYVKNTDYATSVTGGVVKTSTSYGFGITNGNIFASEKTYAQYQSGNNNQAISKGTLENVITGKGLVSNTDYATTTTGGVVKVTESYGTKIASGVIRTNKASDSQITAQVNDYCPIVPSNLDFAVSSIVGHHVTLTQEQYDALATKDANTYYYIVEE